MDKPKEPDMAWVLVIVASLIIAGLLAYHFLL